MKRLILIACLFGLTACAVPMQDQDRDGGIGGTGAPAQVIAL